MTVSSTFGRCRKMHRKSVKFAQSNLIIEMKAEDSDENPTSEQNKPTKVYSCKHVTVLSHCVESWRLILHVDPTKIAPQMHWIYKLEGKQKELICKYFLDSNKTEAEDQLSSEELKIHVFRILRFISNETKPDKMAELDQFTKKFQSDDIKLDKIYLSKDVFEWLQANFINAVAVKPQMFPRSLPKSRFWELIKTGRFRDSSIT
jgi:hypothetical protein